MNIERLERVAIMLDTLPPKRFDIHTFASDNCGTVGCAAGHAALLPEFNALGYHLGIPKWATKNNTVMYKEPSTGYSLYGFSAISAFFDLTELQAEELFHAYAYDDNVTARDVAARIRQCIKEAS